MEVKALLYPNGDMIVGEAGEVTYELKRPVFVKAIAGLMGQPGLAAKTVAVNGELRYAFMNLETEKLEIHSGLAVGVIVVPPESWIYKQYQKVVNKEVFVA